MRGRPAAWLTTAVLIALAAGARPAAGAEELRGTVQLMARGGAGPARGSDVRQAVVYFEPAAARPALRPPAEPFLMTTRQKEFVPRVLAVPRGSRVRFPNDDPILHNAFSVSGANSFDLGLARKGPGKERTFGEPGLVRIFCNVHQSMVAYVLVLDTPFSTSPTADGRFVLSGLPRGAGKLTVWHEQTEPWTMNVQLPLAVGTAGGAGAPQLTTRIEVVRPQIPPHLNKLGKSYFLTGRDRYR